MVYILYFRAIIKLSLSFVITTFLYLPIIFFYKKNNELKNNILIVDDLYYDKKKKLLSNSSITNSLTEFIKNNNKNLSVINFYPDEKNISNLKANIDFIKFFYEQSPKYLFFKSDWKDTKTNNISFFLMFLLKLFEKKIIFFSHSGDPYWVANNIRNVICRYIFDANHDATSVFIKKIKKFEPIAEFGITKDKFFEPNSNRTGGIFYIGRLPEKDNRSDTLNFLTQNNIDLKIYGESTGNFLNKEEFYKVYKNSKITINFPKQINQKGITNEFHFRGRVFDAISHGVLLFDQKNPFMDVLFESDVHYVNYENKYDLLEKLKFYSLNYDSLGIKIAQNGFDLIKREYNSNKVWSNLFDKL